MQRTLKTTHNTVTTTPPHVLDGLVTTMKPLAGPVTQTVCHCHGLVSLWIVLCKILSHGRSNPRVKQYKIVLMSRRERMFSIAIVWRLSQTKPAVWKTYRYNVHWKCQQKPVVQRGDGGPIGQQQWADLWNRWLRSCQRLQHIKQEERHMLREELEYFRNLHKGKPVDRRRYTDHLQKVLEDALVLRDVTRFYLGWWDWQKEWPLGVGTNVTVSITRVS